MIPLTEFSLFEKTSSYDGIYMTLMVNRIQMLYFAIIMPVFLIHPYMIWMIIILGALSQVSIFMLSKWFTSKYASKGYEGFVELKVRVRNIFNLVCVECCISMFC